MTKKELVKPKRVARWYVVNCYSGSEDKVKDRIEKRIIVENLQDEILEVLIANYKELKTKVKKAGEEVQVEKIKNTFPGYIFVKMHMSDNVWFVIRNTNGVTGFVGSSGKRAKPFPMTTDEIEKVKELQGRVDDSLLKINWSIGEKVEIKNGSFKGEMGKIIELNNDNKTATINIKVFGKNTPTEVDFKTLKKLKK